MHRGGGVRRAHSGDFCGVFEVAFFVAGLYHGHSCLFVASIVFFSVAAPSAAVLAAYACFFRFQEVILPRASEETSSGAI